MGRVGDDGGEQELLRPQQDTPTASPPSSSWGCGRGHVPWPSSPPPPQSVAVACAAAMRQVDTFDCGLACVAMVLNSAAQQLGTRCPPPPLVPQQPRPPTWIPSTAAVQAASDDRRGSDGSFSALWNRDFVYRYYRATSGDNRSVWTIDLFLLLHQLLGAIGAAPPRITTTELGCRPEYAQHAFYSDDYTDDERRVGRLFRVAQEARLQVEHRKMPTHELTALLGSGQVLLIVLVDARLLPQPAPVAALLSAAESLQAMAAAACCCLPRVVRLLGRAGGYLGHYIVAKGYDDVRKQVLYNNPASRAATCRIALDVFERARSTFGTDDDVVSIWLGDWRPCSPAAESSAAVRRVPLR